MKNHGTDPKVEEKEQWRRFYQKHFSLDLNFSDIVIPAIPPVGKWKLLIIAQGLTLDQVYGSMSKAFECWKYPYDLDEQVTKNVRDTKSPYALWARDEVSPDVEYLGKSTCEADFDMKIGITLMERMIYEMIYFDETGNHLDIKGLTFCSGSRYPDGRVPYMGCYGWVIRVRWFYPGFSYSEDGIRSAVSA